MSFGFPVQDLLDEVVLSRLLGFLQLNDLRHLDVEAVYLSQALLHELPAGFAQIPIVFFVSIHECFELSLLLLADLA